MTLAAREAVKWATGSGRSLGMAGKKAHIIATWGKATWHEVLGVMIGGIIRDVADKIAERRAARWRSGNRSSR